ncbi:MAG: hypothetical protein JXR67_03900 [Bacteroidales bacterium]|nr:hypothetical protein [Bacteroidales bacterium]
MTYNSDFQEVGKKMPYSVPPGFFEGITEKTLDKARQRDKARRKHVLIWRSMAIAASLTVLIVAGYLLINVLPTGNTEQAAQNTGAGPQNEVQNGELAEVIDTVPVKEDFDNKETAISTVNGIQDEEGINDVLSSLTNEELMELAAMLASDMFMDETENNLQ